MVGRWRAVLSAMAAAIALAAGTATTVWATSAVSATTLTVAK
jgi:hypothetical protein